MTNVGKLWFNYPSYKPDLVPNNYHLKNISKKDLLLKNSTNMELDYVIFS